MKELDHQKYCAIATLKVGIASIICLLVIGWFHIEQGFMALLPIFIIPVVFSTDILSKSRDRLLGALAGSVFCIVCLVFIHNVLIYFLLVLAGFVFCLTYLKQKYFYFTVVFGLTAGIIFMLSFSGHDKAIDFGIAWPREILIGCVILFVVDQLVFPNNKNPKPMAHPESEVPSETKLPEMIQAARIALSVLATVLVCVYFSIPGSIQVVITAFIAALQPMNEKIPERIVHRFIGLVLGIGVAVLFALMISLFPSIWFLSVLYLTGVLFFTYLGLRRSEWFYICVQAGVAIVLLLAFNTLEVVPNLDILGQRIFGVFVGYAMTMCVMALTSGTLGVRKNEH